MQPRSAHHELSIGLLFQGDLDRFDHHSTAHSPNRPAEQGRGLQTTPHCQQCLMVDACGVEAAPLNLGSLQAKHGIRPGQRFP
jgi:hypothetical protein